MSTYRIGTVTVENFGPFADAQIDFSLPGVTVIEGEIHNAKGCSSNGAGKSFLIEAPCWALYGRCIREGYAGDEVIRHGGSAGGCRVAVDLVGGPEPVRVVRHRKFGKEKDKVAVYVGGQEVGCGTNPMTTAFIEGTLGLDFVAYVNTVAFAARDDVKGFFSAPDAERKRVLEKVLGLERFAVAEKIAKARLKDRQATLADRSGRAAALRRRAADARDVAERFSGESDLHSAVLALGELRLKVRQATRALQSATLASTQAYDRVRDLSEMYDAEKANYDTLYAACINTRLDLTSQIDALSVGIAAAEKSAHVAEKSAGNLASLKGGECPTCRQPVDPEHAKKVAGDASQLAAHYFHEADALRLERDQRAKERDAIVWPEPPDPQPLAKANGHAQEAEKQRQTAQVALAGLEAALDTAAKDYALNASRVAALEAEAAKLDQESAALEEEAGSLMAECGRLSFWAAGFGNQGLKSFLIERDLPALTAMTTALARRLLGDRVTVKLAAVRATAKGQVKEELTPDVAIAGMARSYAGASKGQKHRLSLALLLALRDLAVSRAPRGIDQFFADELFDGLDRTGVEYVAELLREMGDARPVVLVTHDERLRNVADRVVTVCHNGDQVAGAAVVKIQGVGTCQPDVPKSIIGPKQAKKSAVFS